MGKHVLFPALVVLLAAAGGCFVADPSIYQGSGTPAPSGRRTASARGEAGARRDDRGDIRVAPTRMADSAREGDIRVPPAAATLPGRSPNNVAIIIEKLGTDARTATAASLAFRYANDTTAIRGGAPMARRNGIRVGVAGRNFRARLGASHRRTRSSTREQVFITCLSGTEGQILMGADVLVQRLGYWGPHGYHVLIERAMVGRSLVVRPTILPGGMVQVTLWPRFTARGRRGAIDVTQLATTVVVRDGQSIVIGGMTSGRDDVGTVLFGFSRSSRSSTMTMILTPKIGGMAINWPKPPR